MVLKKKKLSPEDSYCLGIDASLNGAGLVLMKDFKVIDKWFFTNVVKVANQFPGIAHLNRSDGPARLEVIGEFLQKLLLEHQIDYVAIEDYAYGAKSNSVFQIGGLGEMIRLIIWKHNAPYRDYEISKIKKFATGSGSAEKSQMVLAAFKAGFDVGQYGKPGEDLADAFWIARMLNTELYLHADSNYLKKLNRNQQETFTATSKAFPIPILSRPFIVKRG